MPEAEGNETTRKWLEERGIRQFRGVLSGSIVTQTCRSVGILSIGLDERVLPSLEEGRPKWRTGCNKTYGQNSNTKGCL